MVWMVPGSDTYCSLGQQAAVARVTRPRHEDEVGVARHVGEPLDQRRQLVEGLAQRAVVLGVCTGQSGRWSAGGIPLGQRWIGGRGVGDAPLPKGWLRKFPISTNRRGGVLSASKAPNSCCSLFMTCRE